MSIQQMRSLLFKNKFFLVVLLLFVLLFFVSFQDRLYSKTIIKISHVSNSFSSQKTGMNGQKENIYTQKLTAIIQNGYYKGQSVTFDNKFSSSETLSTKYCKGDKLFITLKRTANGSLTVSSPSVKRDSYLFLIGGCFILLLILLFQKRGLMTLLSVLSNAAFFFFCLHFSDTDAYFDWLWILQIFFYIIITLLFVSGFHKKTVGAVLSTIVSVLLVTLLYLLTIYTDANISYELMPNMVSDVPLEKIFLISTMIGMLGAVMDISVTINSAVSELAVTSQIGTLKSVISSVKEIGHDTMGTMVNVLFFSYLSGSFPIIVLKFSNHYSLGTLFSEEYIFDIIRFLVGSIGIVAAIPISGVISILLFRKGLVYNK